MAEKVANYSKVAGKDSVLKAGRLKLPTTSSIKGIKLAPSARDIVTLKEKPIAVESFGAMHLKAFYNRHYHPFLMPNEVWSDKKISEAISTFRKNIDILVDSDTLNKKTLQKTINQIAPELKGKTTIKDFNDNLSGYERSHLTRSNAVTMNDVHHSTLYLNFQKAKGDKPARICFKSDTEHELEHILRLHTQNDLATERFKNHHKADDWHDVFATFFNFFERSYNQGFGFGKTEVNTQSLLNWFKCPSIEALHKSFETTTKDLIKKINKNNLFILDTDKKEMKQFFSYAKIRAKDEKIAYQSNIRYREILEDPEQGTNSELMPLLYEQMEHFFSRKKIEANKLY